VGSGAGIGGDSGIALVQDVEGGASRSLGDSVNGAMKEGARELGLPNGSVLVKSPREALVEVAQSAALGVMGDSFSMILWEGVPGVASIGVGPRGEQVLGGTITEAEGKLLGVVPREVGFANSGSVGAELWLIKGEPMTLVESTVRLGSIGEVWPSSSLVSCLVVSLRETQSVALGVLGDELWFVLVDMPEVFANSVG
jgi:hypothetical protein